MDETPPTTDDASVAAPEGVEPAPSSLDEALGAEGDLIDEIQQSLSADGANADGQPVARLELEELERVENGDSATMRDLDLLGDVEVEVAVEFGRTRIPLRQLLTLRRGALVELNRRPEQQVTVLANGTPIALGDVVVVDDQIGVHIVELIDPQAPPIEPEDSVLPLADMVDPATMVGEPGSLPASDGDTPRADGGGDTGPVAD